MGKIIVIANQKGGVGKTTTALNLSASLALGGKDILLVDTDPQGNLTSGLGINHENISPALYDVYAGSASLESAIRATDVQHLFIAPSTIDLVGVELELAVKDGREKILQEALKPVRERYQYIFIDCPPSLGILTLNALVAAESILVPVQCEYYCLEGLGLLSRTLKLVRSSFNPGLDIEGILLTMFDSRNTLSKQVESEVRKFFREKVYETLIPRNVTLAESPSHGKPAIFYDIRSKGSQSYLSLAREFLHETGFGQRA